MRPHPSIRKAIKWGGAVVTVLLVVVWIGSGRVCIVWAPTLFGWRAEIREGACVVGDYTRRGLDVFGGKKTRDGYVPPLGWSADIDSQWKWQLRPQWGEHHPWEGMPVLWVVPLWVPLVIPSLIAVAMWWYDLAIARRCARLNLCPKCHYDRAGLAAGAVCPECGAAAPA